jgi:hypothetical protein
METPALPFAGAPASLGPVCAQDARNPRGDRRRRFSSPAPGEGCPRRDGPPPRVCVSYFPGVRQAEGPVPPRAPTAACIRPLSAGRPGKRPPTAAVARRAGPIRRGAVGPPGRPGGPSPGHSARESPLREGTLPFRVKEAVKAARPGRTGGRRNARSPGRAPQLGARAVARSRGGHPGPAGGGGRPCLATRQPGMTSEAKAPGLEN